MRRGKDETRNKAEMQADATRTELRCIRFTDCTVFRHSMTVLQTSLSVDPALCVDDGAALSFPFEISCRRSRLFRSARSDARNVVRGV